MLSRRLYAGLWAVLSCIILPGGVEAEPDGTITLGGQAPNPPVIVTPTSNAPNVPLAPELRVAVSDPEGDPLTVTFYAQESTSLLPDDFTIIALPDTQNYSKSHPEIFTAQTQWIVSECVLRNIVFVAHLGDIVNNWDETYQWLNAHNAMSILEVPPGIPYGLDVGNHDEQSSSPNGTAMFNQYFPYTRYAGKPWYGGHYGNDNDNSYQLFSGGGMDFIIINIEYDTDADPAVLDWADSVLKAHPNRRAIVSSHNLMSKTSPGEFSDQGEDTYEALKDNPNLFLMICGHCSDLMEARRTDYYEGRRVDTLMSDYQDRPNGGDGWLRIMRFSPALHEISVKTYSVTRREYETDSTSEFILPYDMSGAGTGHLPPLETVNQVPSGGEVAVHFPGLTRGKTYLWQVIVSDGTSTAMSPTWRFSTTEYPPDLNLDGDVDRDDLNSFALCLTGAFVEPPPDCEYEDIDGDRDVDIEDFAILQRCLSGVGVAIDPTCLEP